jgi:two-component system cell cycle response regulator
MALPTRLLVLQRPGAPLELVCARLRGWGCQLHACESLAGLLEALAQAPVDIVLIDAGVADGLPVVSHLKSDPRTRFVPVIVATAEDEASVASTALAVGADDVFVLPIEDIELYARIRALARVSVMEVERRRRDAVLAEFGVQPVAEVPTVPAIDRISILLVGPAGGDQIQVMTALGGAASAAYAESAESALERLRREDLDVAIITSSHDHHEIQRLCAAIRADAILFDLPVVLIGDPGHLADRSLPFHWGVSDVLFQPFLPEVLRLRVQAWVRQQRLRRRLRGGVDGEDLAPTTDRLTRLYGHGLLHGFVERLIGQSRTTGTPLSVAAFGIAKMRQINQEHGYAAGDRILAQVGSLIARTTRAEDLPARFGDDRFCLVINGATGREARAASERLATILSQTPLAIARGEAIQAAFRTGVAELDYGEDAAALVGRAFERMQLFGLRQAS